MYRFVVALLQPYPLLLLGMVMGLVLLWRKCAQARGRLSLLTAACAGWALCSTPMVGKYLVRTLEPPRNQPRNAQAAGAGAIVVLSAGVIYPNPATGEVEVDEDTRLRCRHAARLYQQGRPCPVLVSGGKDDPDSPDPSHASLMRDFLLREGVPASDLVVEDRSRTTYENAGECRRLLEHLGVDKVLLVVDAVDMPRARLCFEKQGITCVPAPCHYRMTRVELSVEGLLPSPEAARVTTRVWHEWLGLAWYWLRGRI